MGCPSLAQTELSRLSTHRGPPQSQPSFPVDATADGSVCRAHTVYFAEKRSKLSETVVLFLGLLFMADKLTFPGRDLERATANVAEHAGKGFLNQLFRVLGDSFAKRSARLRAEASEIKKTVTHDGQIARSRGEIAARREQELAEIEHQDAIERKYLELGDDKRVRELAEASFRRLGRDMVYEQERVEQIALKAIEYRKIYSTKNEDREIEDDWLFKFFRYAGQIDEAALLNVLAKALAEASTHGKPRISNRALDTLRFFDEKSKKDFIYIASKIAAFDFVMREHQFDESAPYLHPDDFQSLFELGLIKISRRRYINIEIADMFISFLFEMGSKFEFEYVELTQIGLEIAGLFDSQHRELALEKTTGNWKNRLSMQKNFGITTEFMETFAKKIIAGTSDSFDLGIAIWHIDKNGRNLVVNQIRKNPSDKYLIKFKSTAFTRVRDAGALRDAFFAPFEDFDRCSSDVHADRIRSA